MKASASFLLVIFAVLLGVVACVSTPGTGAVTTTQETIAGGVEDFLAVGLVPVLSNNPGYLDAVGGIVATLRTFQGDSITPDVVSAFLVKTPLSPKDTKTVAGLINAAWGRYVKRYQTTANANLRPDVKLFIAAVADGIEAAAAAVPRS